jgi:hypothetical protein
MVPLLLIHTLIHHLVRTTRCRLMPTQNLHILRTTLIRRTHNMRRMAIIDPQLVNILGRHGHTSETKRIVDP